MLEKKGRMGGRGHRRRRGRVGGRGRRKVKEVSEGEDRVV